MIGNLTFFQTIQIFLVKKTKRAEDQQPLWHDYGAEARIPLQEGVPLH